MSPEIVLGQERFAKRGRFTNSDYVQGIDTYLADERNDVLDPRQRETMLRVRNFFESDHKKGDVVKPTGTGKTVDFVELSKALMNVRNEKGEIPRILVVEPTIKLVQQTLGLDEKKRGGYAKFAPSLNVGSYYTESNTEDHSALEEADVVVTTYVSFGRMENTKVLKEPTEEEAHNYVKTVLDKHLAENGLWLSGIVIRKELEELHPQLVKTNKIPTDHNLLDLFDIVILDESHHVMGSSAANIVDSIGSDKHVLGFTATPFASKKRTSKKHLSQRIDYMDFLETINSGRLAPLVPLGVKSGAKIVGTDIFGSEGDYIEGSLSYLAVSPERNQRIIEVAKVMADLGIGTIIRCMPGSEALHARKLANALQNEGVSSSAVYGQLSPTTVNKLDSAFENGEIDVLTYIRMLGEGWDSSRAKAIINATPMRSWIDAQQGVGRILRPGSPAFSIDIIDEFDPRNPPILASDLLHKDTVKKGEIFGVTNGESKSYVDNVISSLAGRVALLPELVSHYTRAQEEYLMHSPIRAGNLISPEQGHYSTTSRFNRQFIGITDEIIERAWKMRGLTPDKKLGSQDYTIRSAYNSEQTQAILNDLPRLVPGKAYVDNEKVHWLTTEGLRIRLSGILSDVTEDMIVDAINQLDDELPWQPVLIESQKTYKRFGTAEQRYIITKAFKDSINETLKPLADKLKKYFQE